MPETKKSGKVKSGHKNPILITGVHRFGRSKMYHKKGIWIKRNIKNAKKVAVKQHLVIQKTVGGDKNGKTRQVTVNKPKRYHPTAVASKRRVLKRTGIQRKTKLRGSLTPGTICILAAGRHAGKRVVFFKQLDSGLLLVNGPFKINGVPLRRVNQRYVIATSTRLDISKLKLSPTFNDTYFRRDKSSVKLAREEQEGDIFAAPKSVYTVTDIRKKDQAEVDRALLDIVKANSEKKMLMKYLGSPFCLRSGQYPHKMKF